MRVGVGSWTWTSVSSHARPFFPNRSLNPNPDGSIRLRARIEWIRFLYTVRVLTRLARCVHRLRNSCVAASGIHTPGKNSARSSCARTLASTLSVLTFEAAISLVRIGLDMVTACPARVRRLQTA